MPVAKGKANTDSEKFYVEVSKPVQIEINVNQLKKCVKTALEEEFSNEVGEGNDRLPIELVLYPSDFAVLLS